MASFQLATLMSFRSTESAGRPYLHFCEAGTSESGEPQSGNGSAGPWMEGLTKNGSAGAGLWIAANWSASQSARQAPGIRGRAAEDGG